MCFCFRRQWDIFYQTYLPHHFIVTIALSENLRHVKQNEQTEAKYPIFQETNAKVLIKISTFLGSLNFPTIKAGWENC